jgi:class 3 adenylate cyclase/tetratricopeptide (TPR) repeat protein
VVTCRSCGASLEAGDRFCGDCGAPLAGCPACGEPVTAGKRFCRACGFALAGADAAPPAAPVSAAAAAPPPGAGPVAERRVCSVMFCDLVGFTPLSESRDPEAVRELLSQYFAGSRTIIERYGGVVEKFIGDAVMAVWGAPVAAEGDAERAVRAALDVVAAVAELGEQAGVAGLAARAGVVTGEVAITVGAVHEGMVVGDTVNTAARVQTAAAPGQVLADEPTMRLASGGVGFAEAGSHTLKGKAEPVRLWRATRVLAGVGGAQRVDGLEAPLTGRDAELRAIRELFHGAAERRVPRLVLVSGPAGVGKSRLGWEFEKYVDGLAEQVWWHRGRCPAYGQGVAFWALAEIIRQRLSIAEDDPPETATVKLAAGLEEFVPDPAERGYVGARLSRLLGVGAVEDGEPLSREELFAGWRLFFERLAASGPVVLLVEDAQYADSGLLDFLEHLIDWVRGLPVFVLVFARPELSHARPGFGAGRNRSTLTLDPLDPASMDRLVQELVPGMPESARSAVTTHAEGLPLFAVETIRSLIDRDIVRPVEGVYRLVGQLGELEVPGSLHALLAARLDALEPAVRRLVTDAALLGDAFTADALAAVSGQDEAAVRAALDQLLRREVLGVSADPLSPQRGSYQFTHHLLRQVAYDTLARRDRKAGHLAVAAYLRGAFPGDGEEVADVIARHYLDALNAVPGAPDTAEIHDQAVTMLIRAAERAERTGAPARAVTSYVTAAELTAQAPGSASGDALASAGRLWERAAQAALTGSEWAKAVEHAGRARELYLQRGDGNRAAARAQAIAGRALRLWGRHAQAREQLTAAVQALRPDPDADTVRALDELALLEVFAGSPDGDALSTEALVLAQGLGAGPAQLADTFVSRGIYLYVAQRRIEGIAYLTQAARLAEQAGSHTLLGRVHINLAETFVTTDPASAAEAALAATGHLRRTGALDYLGVAVINLAQAQLMLGDWDSAEQQLIQAMEADGLAGNDHVAGYRGWLAALRGDLETAAAMLAGLRDLRSSEDSQDLVFVATVEAFAAAARGEPQEALRRARSALAGPLGFGFGVTSWAWPLAARVAHELRDAATVGDLLGQLDADLPGHVPPGLRAERDLARARLAASGGDPAAGQALAAAVAAVRAHGSPYHLAHALLDHAQHLLGQGDTSAAEAAVAEASAIAGRLRCQPLLNRAEAVAPAIARTPA